jgi:hypothetical protein
MDTGSDRPALVNSALLVDTPRGLHSSDRQNQTRLACSGPMESGMRPRHVLQQIARYRADPSSRQAKHEPPSAMFPSSSQAWLHLCVVYNEIFVETLSSFISLVDGGCNCASLLDAVNHLYTALKEELDPSFSKANSNKRGWIPPQSFQLRLDQCDAQVRKYNDKLVRQDLKKRWELVMTAWLQIEALTKKNISRPVLICCNNVAQPEIYSERPKTSPSLQSPTAG